jgi:hypothetical protein
MSIQRIDIPAKRTHGWQARAHIAPGERLTRLISDKEHGGKRAARHVADQVEAQLKRQAKRIRRARGLL